MPIARVLGVSPPPAVASPGVCAILLLVLFAAGGPVKWPAAVWIVGATLFPCKMRPWLSPLAPWAQTLHDLPAVGWVLECVLAVADQV